MADASGTYTGNGTSVVVSLGFQPEVVRLRHTVTGVTADWHTGLGAGELEIQQGSTTKIDAGGVTVDSDGFTIGDDPMFNQNGVDVDYEAHDLELP